MWCGGLGNGDCCRQIRGCESRGDVVNSSNVSKMSEFVGLVLLLLDCYLMYILSVAFNFSVIYWV